MDNLSLTQLKIMGLVMLAILLGPAIYTGLIRASWQDVYYLIINWVELISLYLIIRFLQETSRGESHNE